MKKHRTPPANNANINTLMQNTTPQNPPITDISLISPAPSILNKNKAYKRKTGTITPKIQYKIPYNPSSCSLNKKAMPQPATMSLLLTLSPAMSSHAATASITVKQHILTNPYTFLLKHVLHVLLMYYT